MNAKHGAYLSILSHWFALLYKSLKCERATDPLVGYILGEIQMSVKQKFWLTNHQFCLSTPTPLISVFDLACDTDLRWYRNSVVI